MVAQCIASAREPLQRNIPAGPYIAWLREAIAEDTAYDVMVKSLLTSQGSFWDHGQTGFYLRDAAMPLEHSAAVSQVFLGTQVQCAQCHDHPTESWLRDDVLSLQLLALKDQQDLIVSTLARAVNLVNPGRVDLRKRPRASNANNDRRCDVSASK